MSALLKLETMSVYTIIVYKRYILCRVILVVDKKNRLFCKKGIFKCALSSNELKSLNSSDRDIPLEDWWLACVITFSSSSNYAINL